MGDATEKPQDNYLMMRGGLASARLTGQHYIITERQGWMLHPDISHNLTDKSNLKIADLATGNGIWAISISKAYPNASITGLDISPTQFPAPYTWPENVKFELFDLFDAVPDKYQNCFDVLHIRLIVAALHDRDLNLLVANLLKMLKPGGFLQWDELSDPGALTVDESLNVGEALEKSYMQRVAKLAPSVWSSMRWVDNLPQFLEKKGFVDVAKHFPPVNPSTLQYESESMVWSLHELMQTVANMPQKGAKEEMEQAEQELQKDADAGQLLAYRWEVALGRKPLEVS